MKKLLWVSGLVLIFGLAPHALAQGFVPIAPIANLTTGDVASQAGLANFFNNLYKYLIGLAAILAIIEIIWGGLEIAVNKDSPSKITDSKGRIYNAIFGLLLVLAPAIVFGIINPKILNLSIGLPELPTRPTTSSNSGTPGSSSQVMKSNGCIITGSLFQKASCQTQAARDQWVASCTTGSTKKTECSQIDPATNQCADTTFAASCDTVSGPITGPFLFIDISSGSILNSLSRKDLQPVATAPNGTDNGGLVMNFVNACLRDGGSVCYEESLFDGSVVCPTLSPQPASQSNKCYSKKFMCRNPQIADLVIKSEKCTRTQSLRVVQ